MPPHSEIPDSSPEKCAQQKSAQTAGCSAVYMGIADAYPQFRIRCTVSEKASTVKPFSVSCSLLEIF